MRKQYKFDIAGQMEYIVLSRQKLQCQDYAQIAAYTMKYMFKICLALWFIVMRKQKQFRL